MRKYLEIAGLVLLMILLIVLAFSISGLIIMLVWNALADYFGAKVIPLWVGILISLALTIVGHAFKSSTERN